jgi:hypothetical protein
MKSSKKMAPKLIALLSMAGFLFLAISCSSNAEKKDAPSPSASNGLDTTPKLPREFIDLLFAEQTIKEVNQFSSTQPVDSASVWGKLKQVEALQKEGNVEEAKKILKGIAANGSAESRTKLWAWNGLRAMGVTPTSPVVLGLVLEVPQQGATEYLAMYADQRARYINYTGKVAAWETHEAEMDQLIDKTIAQSQKFIDKAKLNSGRAKQQSDKVRFSFLTTAGIFQIEKPIDDLEQDGTGIGDIFKAAAEVLSAIVTKAMAN